MKKYSCILFGLLMSGSVFAVDFDGKVERLFPHVNGNIMFTIKDDGCDGGYFQFAIDSVQGKSWYSMLLAAANSGKAVKVNAPSCPSSSPVTVTYILQDF